MPRKHLKSTAHVRTRSTFRKISSAPVPTDECCDQPIPMETAGTAAAGTVAESVNNPANSILLDSQSLAKIWSLVTPIIDERAGNEDFFIVSGYSFRELKKDMKSLFTRIDRNSRRVKHIIDGLL
jgi:hypothetical protein